MPFSSTLKSAAGTCRYCRRRAAVIARAHRDCQDTFQPGWTEMVAIATEAARTHVFDEKTLRLTLAEIAGRSHGDGATVNEAPRGGVEAGRGPLHMADGILTQAEEASLRDLRYRLALSGVLEPAFTAGYYRKVHLTETHPGSTK